MPLLTRMSEVPPLHREVLEVESAVPTTPRHSEESEVPSTISADTGPDILHRVGINLAAALNNSTTADENEMPSTPSAETGQDILHRVGIKLAAALHSERFAIMHEMERRHASLLRLLESEAAFSYHTHLVPQQQKNHEPRILRQHTHVS
jgi:hypothetical protein